MNGTKVTSTNGKLTAKPGITTQPASKTAAAGTSVKFTVAASGNGLTYQWQYRTSDTAAWKNTTATGNKTATLRVAVTAAKNGYSYRCVVSSSNGTKTNSSVAKLTVK